MGLLLPSALYAQCAPDPAMANDAVSCAGTDTDGIRLTASGIALTVEETATVSATGTSAIIVDVPVGDYGYRTAGIDVLGQVSSAGQNAITVWSGAPSADSYYGTQQVMLSIGPDASVSGATALALLPSAGNSYGTVVASVDNAGTLTGTSGIALLGNATSSNNGSLSPIASFSSITNQASGRIYGGIVGALYTLNNGGLIDGGAGSAVHSGGRFSSLTIANEAGGIIRSASGDATILNDPGQYLYLDNAGTITNAGGGAALSGGTLTLTNQAGAAIDGDIVAAGSFNLVNRGSIAGNILATSGGNVIDSSDGVIDGSVSLGGDNNRLIARYVGNRTLATGISGTISAAGTMNAEHVIFAADASVDTPIDLASGFQQLVLAPEADVTVTLEAGFSPTAPLILSGRGNVVNRATMSLAGSSITDLDYGFGSSASFRNEGVIDIAYSGAPFGGGVTFSNHSFVNDGTLRVDGGTGIDMSYNPVVNSGTIIASGTGATLFNGVLTNSGTIASTTGVGIYLFGNVGYTSANSGTISGATIGVTTGIEFTNSGTINGGQTAVEVRPYGYLINASGGVVNGGTSGAVTVGPFIASVANAGTINGDVTFDSINPIANGSVYFALPGGMLNGDLILNGATLVTDLVNTGPGQFAGIAGMVTANSDAILRYAVHADASATLPADDVGPFRNVEYQLGNDTTLTLTASGMRTQALGLAGSGYVDLDADIAVTGGPAIRSAAMLGYPGMTQPSTGLSITSRGSLAITRTEDNYYSDAAVLLFNADNFVNEGDISVIDRLGYDTAGIAGGASITNRGRILLDGGVGIRVTTDAVNAGTISQVEGGGIAKGAVLLSGRFDNQGTINVGGSAVELGGFYSSDAVELTNGGTLLSTQGAAVTASGTSYGAITVRNLAGGVITGTGGTAVRLSRATLSNAGTINGDVELGYAPDDYSYYRGVYVADGGIINGSLTFGRGNDIFVQQSDDVGVTGTIDGGEGDDLYARLYQADATALLGGGTRIGFERDYVGAASGVTVTIDAAATSTGMLLVGGEGTVINHATLDGPVTSGVTSYYYDAPASILSNSIGGFVNRGTLNGGLSLTTNDIVNEGTIGIQPDSYGASLSQYAEQGALSFANSGRILKAPRDNAVKLGGYGVSAVRADNSGTIEGGMSIFALLDPEADGYVAITNSGTIRADTRAALSIDNSGFFGFGGGRYSLTNSGVIEADAPADAAIRLALANADADATIVNEGTLLNSGAGRHYSYDWPGMQISVTEAASTIQLEGYGLTTLALTNAAGGTIEAADALATAIVTRDATLSLDNAGTIRGGAGTRLADNDYLALSLGQTYLAGAVQTVGEGADSIVNSGTIIGSIDLGAGDDVIVNRGTIIGDVYLGDGDDSFTQLASAAMQGIVDGGAGADSFIVDATGGGAINADQFINFERFSQIGTGEVTYSGTFSFDTIGLDGGSAIATAGSTIRAATISVRRQASFGSAGHVIGNVDVAGTLSPGASPGTMTVTGNVALASGSTTIMEITPTISDRLDISGSLTIAGGASLVLNADQPVKPGTTLDLIVAAGGISGSYSTIVRSQGLFGVVIQDDTRIGLLGQFLNDAGFTPQVRRAIDYTNGMIAAGTASDALIDALPVLATASGASNATAFARLGAEPYASATQLGVENGLTIAQAGRGLAGLSADDMPRAFGVAQYLGALGRIAADDRAGVSASRSRSHGLLGGLGIGNDRWSIAGFGGYLDARQTLRPLGSQTDADGWFAGIAGSYALGALRFDATLAYHRLNAETERFTPDGDKAHGRFRLNSWIGDLSLSYEATLGDDWSVRPDIGLSYVATTRSGLREDGGSVWALAVAKDKHDALFADGGVAFGRSRASEAAFRPFVRLGVQYQLQGRAVEALAGFAGSDPGLLSLGARRAGLVGSVAGGAEMRVSARLSLFANASQSYSEDDRRASANIGLKFGF